jgi:hypothetical protein
MFQAAADWGAQQGGTVGSVVLNLAAAGNAISEASGLNDIGSAVGEGDAFGGGVALAMALPVGRPAKALKVVSELPGVSKAFTKLRGGQGWKDAVGNIWKKDKKHRDHWDVSDRKGNKIQEVDFEGNQIWPDGPKNKNKAP